MADKKETTTVEYDVVNRARGFWADFSRPIIYIGTAIILVVGGWFAYKYFYKMPQEKKGNEAIFMAESLFDKMATSGFNKDSAVIVLNGGELEGDKVTGLLSVIKNYGSTDAGDRARYMAGATYLHIKEFDKAVNHLKEFDGNDAYQVKSKAYILLGHAYSELNKTEEALSAYKKAAGVNSADEIITADAWVMAATYADAVGKKDEAISIYKKLKDNYPANSFVKSGEVDKYLARLGVFK